MIPEADLQKSLDHDTARRQAEAEAQRRLGGAAASVLRPMPPPPPSERIDIIDNLEEHRARFAAAALTGLVMHSGFNVEPAKVAGFAVQHADALLKELGKKR